MVVHHSLSDAEMLTQIFSGYGRGYHLMQPQKFLQLPMRSYDLTLTITLSESI